jgi:hypothetical protein
MKSTAKIIAVLALTGLLGDYSGHKPATDSSTAVKPQAQADREMYYIPPPKLPGQWNVEDEHELTLRFRHAGHSVQNRFY